jgi:hypothetical protein
MSQIEALDETLAELAISSGTVSTAALPSTPASTTGAGATTVEPRSESLNAGSAAR